MEYFVFRLEKGDDLKKSIVEYSKKANIDSGCVVSVVGSVKEIRIRKTDGISEYFEMNNFEIISVSGTISKDGSHLHIALADKHLKTFGGHLLNGTIVNTTAEVVLMKFNKYKLSRKYDPNTGYKELEVKLNEDK